MALPGGAMAKASTDKRKLTDRHLKSLKGRSKPYDVRDTEIRGLRVRVMPSGERTFVLLARYTLNGAPTRRALGGYPALGLAEAREKAREWRLLIGRGIDPAQEEERKRAAQLRKQKTTFLAVAEDFIREKLPSERKRREVECDIRREFIPEWGARPIADITALDVRALIKRVRDEGKIYQAHNLLGHVRRLYNWAIGQHAYGIESSPCDRLKPREIIGEKKERTRILNDAELWAAWKAADRLGYPYGRLYKLLMLTGQRRSEVAEAQWSEIDLTKKIWTIPAERMKAGAAHVVPLSDDAIAVLKSLPRFDGGNYLFSVFGKRPVAGFSAAKAQFDAMMLRALREDEPKAKLAGFVIHDIRRTVRTQLSAVPNVSDLVRELVIGHTKPGLHKVYDQYAYLDEKRFALDAWAARLRSIVNPKAGNVVELRAAQ
jgi:integrase